MFKVKYVDSIMMLVRLDLNLIVSLFQHKCEVSETVSTTTLYRIVFIRIIVEYESWVRVSVGTFTFTCVHENKFAEHFQIYET